MIELKCIPFEGRFEFFKRHIPKGFSRPPKVNSVIRLKHDVRRKEIIRLGKEGLTQAEIAEKMNISYSTVKREIKAINEELNKRYG